MLNLEFQVTAQLSVAAGCQPSPDLAGPGYPPCSGLAAAGAGSGLAELGWMPRRPGAGSGTGFFKGYIYTIAYRTSIL